MLNTTPALEYIYIYIYMYKLKNIYHECQTIQKYKTDVLSQINRITGKYVLGYKYTVKSPTGKKLWEQAWR